MLVELTVLNAVCAEDLMADCADREACFGRDELAAVVAGAEYIGEPRDYDGIFNGGLFHDSPPFLFDSPFFSAHECADKRAEPALRNRYRFGYLFFFMSIFSGVFEAINHQIYGFLILAARPGREKDE